MSQVIKLIITGDASSAKKALKDTGEDVEGFSGKVQGVAGKAGAIGAAFAAAVGVGAVGVKFASDFASSASNMNETLSKSSAVFKDQSGAIEEWANGAALGFGQSKQQAVESASSFGNMFVQLGIGRGVAADMSKSMVQMASDFASFHNASPAEANDAIAASFRGEYDALQRFVPTINAAAVQQEAMAMSGKKNVGALTDQEKALATQSLIMKGAGDAAGDFSRTSDGLANSQRSLSAQWEDAKVKLGDKLLPVITEVTQWLSEKMPGAIVWLQTKWVELQPVIQAAGWIFSNVVVPSIKAVIQYVGDTIDRIVWMQNAFRDVWHVIRDTWDNITNKVQSAKNTIGSIASGMWDGIKNSFRDALNWVIDKWNALRLPGLSVGGKEITPSIETPNIPRFAAGGIGPAGRPIIVGEEGPELITLGQTSRIYNARESSALAGGSNQPVFNINYHVTVNGFTGDDVEIKITSALNANNRELLSLMKQIG